MRGLAVDYAGRTRQAGSRETRPLPVAACVVRDGLGRVLMARRRPDQMAAGYWEIPGGKVEPNEGTEAAARRELFEETGLVAEAIRPLVRYRHRFPTRTLDLSFFEATAWSGTPAGIEGQTLEWVAPADPQIGPILVSNTRILRLLSLPRVVTTAYPPMGDPSAWARMAARQAASAGAGAVLLAARALAPAQQVALARRLGIALSPYRIDLWIDGAPGVAGRADAVLSVLRRGERLDDCAGMLTASHDGAASDADVVLAGFDGRALGTQSGMGKPVYALTSEGSAEAALAAGAYGVCIGAEA